MCGISGIINLKNKRVSEEILTLINSSQMHRGPDEGNQLIFDNVGLAHRRLSIIDLNSGRQPISNESGSVWLTFNGEIYNYINLREKLINLGHVFKSLTDSEVIVHLYEEYGNRSIEHLEGMFAFVIYDKSKQTVFAARDRLGQKPLHYYYDNKKLVFASELQALVKHPNIPKNINKQSLHDYLSLQYIQHPNTIYDKIFKLPPGSCFELKIITKQFSVYKYWNCSYNKKLSISYVDAKYELRTLLSKAVEKRMISDVPLGAFLSGGIDSTIIVALMSKISQQPVQTFTVGFNESKYDERNYAKVAAEKFKSNHHEKIVNPMDFSIVEKLVKHYGEPYADSSMLPTYLLSKFSVENVTVALSGDGADEIFAGYYRYLAYKFAGKGDIFPSLLRKSLYKHLNKFLPPGIEERSTYGKLKRISKIAASSKEMRYLDLISKCSESEKLSLYGEQMRGFKYESTDNILSRLYNESTAKHEVEKIMETDLNSYLPGDILTKIDIASMANSLELRSPFLDHQVVEFAASLPLSYKQGFKTRKRILVDAFADMIPKELLVRPKMGFGVPVASWLRNEWKNSSKEILLDGAGISGGFFDRLSIENLLYEHQNMKADHSYVIWSLLIFELWYKENF